MVWCAKIFTATSEHHFTYDGVKLDFCVAREFLAGGLAGIFLALWLGI
jgi:hypothetical protein